MKQYIAAFDVGTTAVKGVVVTTEGKVVYSSSINIDTIFQGEYKEQKPSDWYSAFCKISREFFKRGFKPTEFLGIVMSGQMQDLIMVDRELNPVDHAILYSDGRATREADEIIHLAGDERIKSCTGNHFDGSMPFAKLLWQKKNHHDCFAKAHKVLISAKDYCVTRLTGNFVTDATSAATAGLMDIHSKKWMSDWCDAVGISTDILPEILYADEKAGYVTHKAAHESGYAQDTPVYCGTGDAGATTLASGISRSGDYNINLGTSGWIACISDDALCKDGVFNLAAIQKNVYINVVPFLNAGNVHKWVSSMITPDELQGQKYDYAAKLLEASVPASNGLLVLPYLVGERFPVMDTHIKGCIVGATPETTKNDVVRACLEGVAFSIRYGIECIGKMPKSVSIIGGGAKERLWCQIISDILGQPVIAYENSEILPSVAISSCVMVGEGLWQDYSQLNAFLMKSGSYTAYQPCKENEQLYNAVYEKYKKVYPAVKTIYE
ncbi:FGGY family carbohydrate kinase [Oscillospiraceae bacterium PP1C4]